LQIIVLGMHRSGTSAVTRLINMMGAYLGPENQILPAKPDNPKGFWERADVIDLNNFLLNGMHIEWHLPSALDLNSVNASLTSDFTERAGKILLGIDSHRPWVLKDPRLCLLLPLWLPLLEAPVCVHVVRHPVSTAQSLAKRDRFPLHFGIVLWEYYNERALVVSSGLPRFSICYETLMERPMETVELLYKQLCDYGVRALHLPSEREVNAFLETDLRHYRSSEEQDAIWLTPAQTQLWKALRNSKLKNLVHGISENSAQITLLADYEKLLREQRSLNQRDIQLAATQEHLAATQEHLAIVQKKLIDTELEVRRKAALLNKNSVDLKSLRRFFEVLHHDTQITFESLTWRIGFAIAETGRRLGVLQRTILVQDHVSEIARKYQSWLRHHSSLYESSNTLNQEHFNEEDYLSQNPDVQAAIDRGEFSTGLDHFLLLGQQEIANGTRINIPEPAFKRKLINQEIANPDQYRESIASWSRQPLISIVMPVYNVDPRWLEAAIKSVIRQVYSKWELCIADDCSTRQETLDSLHKINDSRCKIKFIEKNLGIAGASNVALKLASGEYVAFLDHDDELTPDALYYIVKAINEDDPDLIYSDEDKLSLEDYLLEPHFKPDYSPDLILSTNYICHLSVYRKALIDRAGPFREGFEGSQDHDLVLRVLDHTDRVHHIPQVLYHWRMIPGSTAAEFNNKNYAWEAGRRAVEDTLRRRGIIGEVTLGQHSGTYRARRLIQGQPRISILMPFRDQPELLRLCLDSIIEKTTYFNFDLLGISNNSIEPATFALMERYSAIDERIRFIRYDIPFNYAAINNFAASQADGEHLLLLNNDMLVINPDWLEALLEHSQRSEVGAVGAKLYYPDDTIQHGGVIIGLGGIAGHAHRQFQRNNPGYFSRLYQVQNLSAVTGACLMVKKAVYQDIGGMDEKHLPVAFNDVDFCLRLREKGYLNVFTPYCELYHYESRTRGLEDTPQKQRRFAEEVAYMRKRHRAILRNGDPYYNPNLPLDRDDFGML
jgi:O-antigen biosynthesis protein